MHMNISNITQKIIFRDFENINKWEEKYPLSFTRIKENEKRNKAILRINRFIDEIQCRM